MPKKLTWNGFSSKTSKDVRCAFYCSAKAKGDRVLYAQYNPEVLEYERSATYAEMTSPGMNYPLFQYVRGNSSRFQIELFYYEGHTGSGNDIRYCQKWFESCLPPKKNQKPKKSKSGKSNVASAYSPPTVDIRFGYYKLKGVLASMKVTDNLLNKKGKPVMSKVTLDFIRVGNNSHF